MSLVEVITSHRWRRPLTLIGDGTNLARSYSEAGFLLSAWELWWILLRTTSPISFLSFLSHSETLNSLRLQYPARVGSHPINVYTPQSSPAIPTTMTEPNGKHKAGEYLYDVKIAQSLVLDKVAVPQCKIVALLKCSCNTVHNALATFLFETSAGRNITWKHEWKTTECEDRYIERTLKQNFDLPLKDIINIIGVPISEHTVQRQRSKTYLGSYIVVKKPTLRVENIKKRLEWVGIEIQRLDSEGLETCHMVGWVKYMDRC